MSGSPFPTARAARPRPRPRRWEQTALPPLASPEACAERGFWCVCRAVAGVWAIVGRSVVKHDALATARALLASVDAPAYDDVALVSPEGARVRIPKPRRAP